MIRELDMVTLVRDLPEQGLRAGDLGCVLMIHGGGRGCEVEFATVRGVTVAVVTLRFDDVRPVTGNEIPHARSVA